MLFLGTQTDCRIYWTAIFFFLSFFVCYFGCPGRASGWGDMPRDFMCANARQFFGHPLSLSFFFYGNSQLKLTRKRKAEKKNKKEPVSTPTIAVKEDSYRQQTLPSGMGDDNIKGFIDPNNDSNHYVFGPFQCWKYIYETQTYIELESVKQLLRIDGHDCVYFQIEKNDENSNKIKKYYALQYGGINMCYHIFDLQNETWIKTKFDTKKLRLNKFKYFYGYGLRMITDIFQKNKIHIIGGDDSYQKYGWFEFTDDVANLGNVLFFF